MFGATIEMAVSAVATRAQTTTKLVAPSLDVSKDRRCICHSGLLDPISQVSLPLSFGLVDATSAVHSHVLVAIPLRGTTTKDLIHTLAYKMLQILVFSFVETLATNFAPTQVFHLVGKMLEGKAPMPSLEVSQANIEASMGKYLVNLQVKLAIEAIAVFEEGVLQ